MSLIFHQYARIRKEAPCFLDQDKHDLVAITAAVAEKQTVVVRGNNVVTEHLGTNSEKGKVESLHLFTNSEKFVDNALKRFSMEQLVHFVPKIIFWMKPSMAADYAIRILVRNLTGSIEKQVIEGLIMSNPGLVQYVVPIYKAACITYSGEILNRDDTRMSNELRMMIYASLVENLLLREYSDRENDLVPYVRVSSILGKNYEWNEGKDIERGSKDLDSVGLIAIYTRCVICHIQFESRADLATHVQITHFKEASYHRCIDCAQSLTGYHAVANHAATFCRAVGWKKNCEACMRDRKHCQCPELFANICKHTSEFLLKHKYIMQKRQFHFLIELATSRLAESRCKEPIVDIVNDVETLGTTDHNFKTCMGPCFQWSR